MICDLIWFLDYFLMGVLTVRLVLRAVTRPLARYEFLLHFCCINDSGGVYYAQTAA